MDNDACVSHCCADHGCKYGKSTCVVATGTREQEFACEDCCHDATALREKVRSLVHTIRTIKLGYRDRVHASADTGLPFTRLELLAKLKVELDQVVLPEVTEWSDEDDAAVDRMGDSFW